MKCSGETEIYYMNEFMILHEIELPIFVYCMYHELIQCPRYLSFFISDSVGK